MSEMGRVYKTPRSAAAVKPIAACSCCVFSVYVREPLSYRTPALCNSRAWAMSWRRFVHSNPIIVTHESSFLNSIQITEAVYNRIFEFKRALF